MVTKKDYNELEEKYNNLNKLVENKLPRCKKCGSHNIKIMFGIQMDCLDCHYGFSNTEVTQNV